MPVFEVNQYLQKADWQAIARATKSSGVVSGLAPSWVSGMVVRIGTGSALVDGSLITKTASTDLTLTSDANYPRKALIVLASDGSISALYGTAEPVYPDPGQIGIFTARPRPPDLPSNAIPLAEVWIPAGSTSLSSDWVYDKRWFVQQVTTGMMVDSAVTSAKIASGAVTTAKIADLAVTSAKLASASVITDKIADLAVTSAKLAASSVLTDKIADGAVSTAKLADLAVTTAKLADSAVSEVKIASGAVTGAKIASGAVTSDKIADGAVTTAKVADGSITNAKLASGFLSDTKGDIGMSTYKLRTSNLLLKQYDFFNMTIRDSTDTHFRGLYANPLQTANLLFLANLSGYIYHPQTTYPIIFQSGSTEVARIVNETFQLSRGKLTGDLDCSGYKLLNAVIPIRATLVIDETETSTTATSWSLFSPLDKSFDFIKDTDYFNAKVIKILLQAMMAASGYTGYIGFFVDAETTPRATITVTETSYTVKKASIDISNLADGLHTLYVKGYVSGSTLFLRFFHALGGET